MRRYIRMHTENGRADLACDASLLCASLSSLPIEMPAQKRPMPPLPPPPPPDDAPPVPPSQLQQQEDEEEEAVVTAVKEEEKSPSNLPQEQDGSGGHAFSRILSVKFFILFEVSQPWAAAVAAFVWLRRLRGGRWRQRVGGR